MGDELQQGKRAHETYGGNRITTVTRMCADYDSYLKIGPKLEENGLRLSCSSSSTCPLNDNNF